MSSLRDLVDMRLQGKMQGNKNDLAICLVLSNMILQAEDENSLYFIVRTGRASLQQTVDDWIEEYKVS